MNVLQHLLIPLPVKGFFCILLLFSFCFFLVHLARLVLIGAKTIQKVSPPPTEKKEEEKATKKALASQEPIYYIVEKKTRRAKPSYQEPKQIKFK